MAALFALVGCNAVNRRRKDNLGLTGIVNGELCNGRSDLPLHNSGDILQYVSDFERGQLQRHFGSDQSVWRDGDGNGFVRIALAGLLASMCRLHVRNERY